MQLQHELQQQFDKGQLPGGYDVQIPKSSTLLSILETFFPYLIIALFFFFLLSQMQGGGSRVMNFGKSRAKLITKDTPKTTFADVAGADEAIEELQEIKEFLQNPGQVPGDRREDPQGRAALRPARNRQDAARPRGRRRGGRPVLLDLRF